MPNAMACASESELTQIRPRGIVMRFELGESEATERVDLAAKVRDIPDFPKPGIIFKDITTLLADGPAFHHSVEALAERFRGDAVDLVVGLEARGFIFAAPVAYLLR